MNNDKVEPIKNNDVIKEQQSPVVDDKKVERIKLTFEYLPCINYSLMVSGIETCRSFIIENNDEKDWRDVAVTINGEFVKENVSHLDLIGRGRSMQLNSVSIAPDAVSLISLTEAISTTFHLEITLQGELFLEKDYPISFLAYDQWMGASVMPELISAFVIPNHPCLSQVLVNTARILEKLTGSSSLDAYQTQNRNRVRLQIAALYEALREVGIIYSEPPAGFGKSGQRLRLADKVLLEKLGTCIDTTLLFASCLEIMGIYPIIIICKDHAFVGAWLTPCVFPHMVCDDASYLLKEMADGNNNVVLVETTSITSSESIPFEESVKLAEVTIRDEKAFRYFVDVYRCRLGNITPLPQIVDRDGVRTVTNDGMERQEVTPEINSLNHYDLRLDDDRKNLTKQQIWERKLLDFSLRNNLINTRIGRKVVPFISFNIDHLEDHLQDGEDFTITACPETKIQAGEHGVYDSQHQAAQYHNLVIEFLKDNKIVSYLTDTELQNALKYIYRTARTSIEENGANSLFLTLGMLKWFETERSEQPRFAPILLLPIDIIRKTGNNYVIRKRDEEIFLNISLVELLKQNYNINLSQLQKELPKDDSGVDVRQIFTYIRRTILEKKKWDVLEESMLGLFSFNKFVMWNDIHTNADKLKENLMVASLMGKSNKLNDTDEKIDARDIDTSSQPMDFAIPLDVDSSQIEAVVESGRGKSFILQGPPGTGKSQTITNMIANALFQGKRVLFVAEKMAALSVVESRLKKIGIGAFCMELHSNKVTKKHFLDQMEQVLNSKRIAKPETFLHDSEELFAERKKLMAYMQAIHSKTSYGISLYDSLVEYMKIAGDEIDASSLNNEMLNADKYKSYYDEVAKLDAILQVIGTIKDNPLHDLEPINNRINTLDEIKNGLQSFICLKSKYDELINKVNNKGVFDIHSAEDLEWLAQFKDIISGIDFMSKNLMEVAYNDEKRFSIQKQIELGEECCRLKEDILQTCNEDIFIIDAKAYKQMWEEIQMKWFLPRFFAQRRFVKRMRQYGSIETADVDDILNSVIKYQSLYEKYNNSDTKLSFYYASLATPGSEQWALMSGVFKNLPLLFEVLSRYIEIKNISKNDLFESFSNAFDGKWNYFKQDYITISSNILDLYQQIIDNVKDINANTINNLSLSQVKNCANVWIDYFDNVKDWCLWIDEKHALLEAGLNAIVDKLEHAGDEPIIAVNAFMKGIYHRIIRTTIDENDQLRMFNGLLFRKLIDKYRNDTKRFQELSKQELYTRLVARVPSAATASSEGSEISILKRNIANGGRGNSIRGIIDSIPTLLPRLCPCMLMSPLSVAQFIDLSTEKFDIVIFDEASQMPTSEAVGAIARGNSLIVVGDNKQMPPTSFFSSSQVDEEEADMDDMESILDDCNTLSMKEYQLNWHYRSKHESLIAFSNMQYYGNKLLTFPSVDDRDVKVRLIPIEGTYDKGRTRSNPEEAKAIVSEVIKRLSDPHLRQLSIGIISFSKVQQNLIEDILNDELDKHQELKEFANDSEEPIFVKNLENVQGDERDVILFSVGYGPDMYGKVSMNFGPLNNTGGERRLNVAVSRARYEMLVYSTLRSNQIDLRRSNAKGVVGLKNFLEYAESGNLPMMQENEQNIQDNTLVEQIADAINQAGYLTTTNIGRSEFKVDIAVSTKDAPNKYILCIMCDGKNYYETKTTRDREIVQPSILGLLNWKTMRVYCIDWYDNRERVILQILDELNNIVNDNSSIDKNEPEVEKFSLENIQAEDTTRQILRNSRLRPYVECAITKVDIHKDFFQPYLLQNENIIKAILRAEQPACYNYLCRKLAKIWGFGHTGNNIQRAVSIALSSCYQVFPMASDKVYFWLDKESSEGYSFYRCKSSRSIEEIPEIEVYNAILEVFEEEFSLPSDKIPTLVAKKFGFGSAASKIRETIMDLLAVMVKKGDIKVNNGLVSLADNRDEV